MNYLQYMQQPAGPIYEIPAYLQAQQTEHKEAKPVDSFLGSDYVHNFILKHKDVMDPESDTPLNSPAYRIDLAYMRLVNKGSQIDGVTYNFLKNTQNGQNASSQSRTLSMSTTTPNYFPNRQTHLKIYNGLDGQSYTAFAGYLPSIGNYTLINNNDGYEQLNENRDSQYKERASWIKDQSKPDWYKYE